MTQQPFLNITMPVFNRPELTALTITSLRKCTDAVPFILTVVDNGSDQTLVTWLRQQHRKGQIDKLFLLPQNMGISCACNIGWQMTPAAYFCKLDNDMFIQSPTWLEHIFSLWRHGLPLSTLGPAWGEKETLKNGAAVTTPEGNLGYCLTNLPGCALFVPKAVSDLLGYFNEDYGLYGAEDGDYGLRINCAGFPQYTYNCDGLLRHMGKWPDSILEQYRAHGLNRENEHRRLFQNQDGTMGMFPVNHYLFNACIRNWRVPLRYEIADIADDGNVHLRERKEYRLVKEALLLCKQKMDRVCMETGNYDNIWNPGFIEELKEVMKSCGQECVPLP